MGSTTRKIKQFKENLVIKMIIANDSEVEDQDLNRLTEK